MKLIIVDNHGLFLHSLKDVLLKQPVINEVYTFSSFEIEQLESCIKENTIDLVILDINLDGIDGFSVGEHLREIFPKISIAFLTGHSNQVHLQERASKFDAAGFFTKESLPDELVKQIQEAVNGRKPGIVDKKQIGSLTKTEQDVLYWLSRGLRNEEIAEELNYSTRNIERLKSVIYTKLEVTNEKEAIRKCFELGYDLID